MMKNRSYANRGMQFERIIDMTNNKYRNSGIADIRKVPTPFKTMHVKGNRVTGHFEKPSWVDYCGIYKGKTIIFDAKETNETNFPLKNLSHQQYDLLKSWHEKGAVAFLLIHFMQASKYYYLPFETLQWAYERAKSGGRKSIAATELEERAIEVKSKNGFIIHYLEVME